MALIKCPECGKEFSDRASACPNCSCPTKDILQDLQNAAVESEKLKQIICPRCGSSVKADGDYCDNCGRRITPYKNDSTTAVIPQVPSNPNLTENSFYTICPNCGYHNEIGTFVCKNCSHKYTLSEYELYGLSSDDPVPTLVCPKCGGHNIHVSLQDTREKTITKSENRKKSFAERSLNHTGRTAMNLATLGMWGAFTRKKSDYAEVQSSVTTIFHKKIAICQTCGKSWEIS